MPSWVRTWGVMNGGYRSGLPRPVLTGSMTRRSSVRVWASAPTPGAKLPCLLIFPGG